MYTVFFKRFLDFILSLMAIVVLFPLLLVLVCIGTIAMRGNPFFIQPRPGKKGKDGKERIFYLIKLRTMSNARDEQGNLLPDEIRLNSYGRMLRLTSLDELPSIVNILLGDLSIVGPRPQLVRDMVFMTEKQRERHNTRPGLTGLAQVNGRNNITWEKKFEWDLKYVQKITLYDDIKIVFRTIIKVLKREDVVREGTASDIDYGDYLLQSGKINQDEYERKQAEARQLLDM